MIPGSQALAAPALSARAQRRKRAPGTRRRCERRRLQCLLPNSHPTSKHCHPPCKASSKSSRRSRCCRRCRSFDRLSPLRGRAMEARRWHQRQRTSLGRTDGYRQPDGRASPRFHQSRTLQAGTSGHYAQDFHDITPAITAYEHGVDVTGYSAIQAGIPSPASAPPTRQSYCRI